ncbi:hypothetical protein QTP70_027631 [Hemibagrus guttatus]|uniref:Tc1-like transposase DDE domain-containing protein n=1 Tax=Hemibagrus guttatus TaxID=175788 RepID=A0AAE0Q1Q4_9TELE|nr:hypothetical protein QTP70_027631 [Hemibagrus guttatus]
MEHAALSKTQVFLANASLFYKDTCPEQARFLMRKQQLKGPALPGTVLCPFCFQWRRPGDYHVRLQPKCRPSVRIKKLLRKERTCKRLSSQEIKLLQRFRRASTVLMATCHICNKTSRQIGMNREFLGTLPKNTPVSRSKCRTPQSANKTTPKPNLHDKTPSRTPVSRSSECTSSSKSGSGKKSAFSRLKKLLMLEGSQKRVGLGPLVPMKGTLNASAYQDILDNFMLPTLWEQFGDGSFLFQHDCRHAKTWMIEFGVEELDWPAQSPDLNPIEYLWDELEQKL